MAGRRGPSGPIRGLVVLALIAGAAGLLWMAFAVADFRAPVTGGADAPAAQVDPSRPPSADEPAPSGWAPVEFAAIEGDAVDLAAPAASDLAASLLDQVVTTAPVVVTIDVAEEPGLGAARGLARELHAPLLVLDRPDDPAGDDASPGPSATATTSASPSPDGDASEGATSGDVTEGATDESSEASEDTSEDTSEDPASEAATEDQSTPAPSTEDLLADLGVTQVVAVGTPPDTSATVHQVTVEAAATPSESASSDAASEASSGASSGASPDATPAANVTRPEAVDAMLADAAAIGAPDGLDDVMALVGQDELAPDLEVALELAGIDTVALGDEDPRRDTDLQSALADVGTTVLAVADDQWPELERTTVAPDWPGLVRSAVEAPELFGGGKVLFPDRTFIASYGNFRGAALGILGETDPEGSVAYTKGLVEDYEGLVGDSQPLPAFEIIATVASGDAEADGSYSRKEDIDDLTEWVDVALDNDVYVILDLQPGREDFLTQAKRLEDLLRRPNVGLALDPEWRLEPDEVHLEQIGSVTTAEVNEVSAWLAEIVRDEVLPQKFFMIHGFRLDMLTDREDLDFHAELATMIQMDGQGPQQIKDDTYESLVEAGPDELWWGWKNFYDEDSPETRSPEDTAAIEPTVYFVSYQ